MNIDFATKEDFQVIDTKLSKILEVLEEKKNAEPTDWMKSAEVKKLLGGCSDSTLANYRNKNVLPFRLVGGTYYYPRNAVNDMLNNN